jgi:hypothetical protein
VCVDRHAFECECRTVWWAGDEWEEEESGWGAIKLKVN